MKIIAKALLRDINNKILILKRSDTHPNFPHHSDFPGGEVEDKENGISAIIREVFEETGIILLDSVLNVVYEKAISKDVIHLVYFAKVGLSEPRVTLSWEHDSFIWQPLNSFKNEKVPDTVDPYYLTVLEYINSLTKI